MNAKLKHIVHPNSNDYKVWIIHPFSLTPQLFFVENSNKINNNHGWWAPCIWCACGISTLIGGNSNIYTKLSGEKEPITIYIRKNKIVGNSLNIENLYTNFLIPIVNAWDNVHHFCGTALVFKNKKDITTWCKKHGYKNVNNNIEHIDKICKLGKIWYGKHADQNWIKWNMNQAKQIFKECELNHPIWKLPDTEETF